MTDAQAARIVVFDDDPTGTQTVADLPVVLTPDTATLSAVAAAWSGPVWVLTNTRAMPLAAAQSHLAATVASARAVFGPAARFVLRGDSTLRGHVLGEIDTLSTATSVALFVPAFIEQGRVTIHGVHYVTVGDDLVEVSATEYARDPEFGYRSSDLVEWVAEREAGRTALQMPLEVLRAEGPSALADLLVRAPPHAVVVPDAESAADLRIIHAAWIEAQRRGRAVVLRCASSLASIVTGTPGRPVALSPVAGPVLVVCGSYTSGAAAQLAALDGLAGLAAHEIDLSQALAASPDVASYRHRLATRVAASLQAGPLAVLSTPRAASTPNLSFAAGEKIMDVVVGTVRDLQGQFAAIITKGGITSARIARDALGMRVAYVRGQVAAGIPVWAEGFPPTGAIDQVVVPGNVGPPDAIRAIVGQLVPGLT
jgi:uncharacterized protein YgbK (DUF1537 family)